MKTGPEVMPTVTSTGVGLILRPWGASARVAAGQPTCCADSGVATTPALPDVVANVFDEYVRLARKAIAGHNDDYRRGYLNGLRRHYQADQFVCDGEYAYPGTLAGSTVAEYARGFFDGTRAAEPTPSDSLPL